MIEPRISQQVMEAELRRQTARRGVMSELAALDLQDRAIVLAQALLEVELQIGTGQRKAPAPAPIEPAPAAIAEASPAAEERPLPPPPRPRAAEAPPRPAETPPSPPAARPSPRSGTGMKATRRKSTAGRLASKVLAGKTTGEAANAVAAVVRAHPGIGANQIAEKMGTTRARLTRTIRLAKSLGLIVKRGEKSWSTYHPPPG